jgi:hypothetical protein
VTKAASVVVLAGSLLLSGVVASVAVRDSRAADLCRVSTTSSHPVPGRPSFNFGSALLAVGLPKDATFRAIPDGSPGGGSAFIQKNGWIRTKVGWFAARGAPRVTGLRVDRTGRRLRADLGPLSFTSNGTFYPSLLYFPALGCWRITATAGSAHLSAIVLLTRATRRG